MQKLFSINDSMFFVSLVKSSYWKISSHTLLTKSSFVRWIFSKYEHSNPNNFFPVASLYISWLRRAVRKIASIESNVKYLLPICLVNVISGDWRSFWYKYFSTLLIGKNNFRRDLYCSTLFTSSFTSPSIIEKIKRSLPKAFCSIARFWNDSVLFHAPTGITLMRRLFFIRKSWMIFRTTISARISSTSIVLS